MNPFLVGLSNGAFFAVHRPSTDRPATVRTAGIIIRCHG
jgi:hypothetical protein